MSDVSKCVRDAEGRRTVECRQAKSLKMNEIRIRIDNPNVLRFDHDWVDKRCEAFNFGINFEETIRARDLRNFLDDATTGHGVCEMS